MSSFGSVFFPGEFFPGAVWSNISKAFRSIQMPGLHRKKNKIWKCFPSSRSWSIQNFCYPPATPKSWMAQSPFNLRLSFFWIETTKPRAVSWTIKYISHQREWKLSSICWRINKQSATMVTIYEAGAQPWLPGNRRMPLGSHTRLAQESSLLHNLTPTSSLFKTWLFLLLSIKTLMSSKVHLAFTIISVWEYIT